MTPSAVTLTPTQRALFLDVVHRHFGIRGSDYGASRLDQAVNQVLPTTTFATPDELLAVIAECTGQLPKCMYDLVEHLTVGETYFLRDPAQIAALRETILPDILMRRTDERRIRMWSAGCSTGEEPYTLAILLLEKHLTDWDVLLVGTDVNRESLRVAREGRYPAWSFRATPEYVRDRYFEPVKNSWRVIEPIRRMARFAWTNLGAESMMPPSADLDLVVCRNVTIYFDQPATQRLYRGLVDSLAPGGWLMLGPSDPMPANQSELERVEAQDTVLWRKVYKARPAVVQKPHSAKRAAPREPARPREVPTGDGQTELEAGLLALEAGSLSSAVECLRRATFRDPNSIVGQFALGRAYVMTRDLPRAQAAMVQTRRLLAPLAAGAFVPGSDSVLVETLRQTIQTHLDRLHE
jgi:chemotaxis methyl-accepting protein methylase